MGSLLSDEAVDERDAEAALVGIAAGHGVRAVPVEDEGGADDREALAEGGGVTTAVEELGGRSCRGDREEDGGSKEEND